MNRAGQKGAAPGHVVLRVIEYRGDGREVIRLLTDLLDPDAYPAAELAALYRERWEAPGASVGPAGCPGSRSGAARWCPGSSLARAASTARFSPVQPRVRDLRRKTACRMPQHQDLRILRGIIPRDEHQPAEHPDHEQVDEADEHERRA
jgi:hypothetical protein